MKLRVGKRAQQQANEMEAWWGENRPAAPTLFIDELEATFRYRSVKSAGVRWPTQRRPRTAQSRGERSRPSWVGFTGR